MLFVVGSACFAVASVPAIAEVVPASVIGSTYFVGSIFFTVAGYLQVRQAMPGPGGYRWLGFEPASSAWWAAAIQSIGTLWFNVSTFEAMVTGLTVRQQDLRIWTPDVVGSVFFLVASSLAVAAVGWWPGRRGHEWRSAVVNLLGSVFFMIAAIAAFVLPSTSDLLDASVANSGTLLGALCFLGAAEADRREIERSARTGRPSRHVSG